MVNERNKNRYSKLSGLIMILSLFSIILQGCQQDHAILPPENNQVNENDIPLANISASPNPADHIFEHSTPEISPVDNPQNAWPDFPPPVYTPATPLPPAAEPFSLDEDTLVWVLLGLNAEPPFAGQTQAIHLLLINRRFSKASMISIPPDLFVYIPGFTMQRLNTAYAVGGVETLRMTLAYNFGVLPSRFVLAHPGDFKWLIDDLNGIEVTVFSPIKNACSGIPAGWIKMDGTLAYCYASFREGIDEVDRMRRQQQLLQIIFRDFSQNGNLIHLPVLFASYQGWIKTDFDLPELMAYIPLALRLADPGRIGYYMLGWDQVSVWEIPGHSQAEVFLPKQEAVRQVFEEAINNINQPSPFTNHVQTLEAQLTAVYASTATAYSQITPTPTVTPTPIEGYQSSEPWSPPTVEATATFTGYP